MYEVVSASNKDWLYFTIRSTKKMYLIPTLYQPPVVIGGNIMLFAFISC